MTRVDPAKVQLQTTCLCQKYIKYYVELLISIDYILKYTIKYGIEFLSVAVVIYISSYVINFNKQICSFSDVLFCVDSRM